jgi:hypothetical protein
MNYVVVVAKFLELVVVVEYSELLKTEDRTVAKVAKIIVPVDC